MTVPATMEVDYATWTPDNSTGNVAWVSPDGLTVYSPTKGRYYTRKFNHATAREMYAAGMTIQAIATHYGVHEAGVRMVVQPHVYTRMIAYSKQWKAATCEICGGYTVKANHAARKIHDGHAICNACRSKARRSGIREIDGGIEVRCSSCETWKGPDRFERGKRYPDVRPGGFKTHCKTCGVTARRAYRIKHMVPCEAGCGRMVEGKGRANHRAPADRPYLCLGCWRLTHSKHIALDPDDYSVIAVHCLGACREWWEPDRFGPGTRFPTARPEGFADTCLSCSTL